MANADNSYPKPPADELDLPPGELAERRQRYVNSQQQMAYYVTALFDDYGRRRSREDIDKRGLRAGLVRIEPVNPDEHPGRPASRAVLITVHPAHTKPYFGPLFNPQLTVMDEEKMVLRGFSIAPDGGATIQAWLLRKCSQLT